MNRFLNLKLIKNFFSVALLVLLHQSIFSDEILAGTKSCVLPSVQNCGWWQGDCRTDEEICTTDQDGYCWEPPRIIDKHWNKCFQINQQISKDYFCPKYSELNQNHTLYLIDTTNGTSEDFKSRLDTIINLKTELIGNTAPYTRLTFVELTDTENVVGLESELTFCRPRTGDNSPFPADKVHKDEGEAFVKGKFQQNFIPPIRRALEKIKVSPASDKSLIFEHLKQINLPKYSFTSNDYKNRRIVMLSDFLQNSDRFKPGMKEICRKSSKKGKWNGACDSFTNFYTSIIIFGKIFRTYNRLR